MRSDRTRARLQVSDEDFIADAEHLDEGAQMRAAVELVLDGIGTRLPADE